MSYRYTVSVPQWIDGKDAEGEAIVVSACAGWISPNACPNALSIASSHHASPLVFFQLPTNTPDFHTHCHVLPRMTPA